MQSSCNERASGTLWHLKHFLVLRQGSLCAYDYGVWDLSFPDYPRWSINFYALNSSDVLPVLNNDTADDEVIMDRLGVIKTPGVI